MPTLLTTREAAERMGVKPQTLYAYVSRGVLQSYPSRDGRTRRFDAKAIDALVRRGRPRQSSRMTSINLLIETRLTSLSPDGVRYRGYRSSDLAASATFEQVAQLLWTGALPAAHRPWIGLAVPLDKRLGLASAVRSLVTYTQATEPPASLDAATVARAGEHLLASIAESLPLLPPVRANAPSPTLVLPSGARHRQTIAARVWPRLSPRRPTPELVQLLNAALILLADHDVAASTFAVRIAASVRASPYGAVSAGLSVLSGALHGGAGPLTRRLLDDAGRRGPAAAVADVVRQGRRVPGFGHTLYPGSDPRADTLLQMIRLAPGSARLVAVSDAVRDVVATRTDRAPNIDFAMALFTQVAGMDEDAPEAIMAIARIAGWLGHAIEEYQEAPLRFRPQARYLGPAGPPAD